MTAVQPELFSTLPAAPAPTWIAPPVDLDALARIEAEGRSPFGSEEYDPEQVQAMANETLIGLVEELVSLDSLDRRYRVGRPTFKNSQSWALFQQNYPAERLGLVESYEVTLGAIMELWGEAGRDAFDHEARCRAAARGGH